MRQILHLVASSVALMVNAAGCDTHRPHVPAPVTPPVALGSRPEPATTAALTAAQAPDPPDGPDRHLPLDHLDLAWVTETSEDQALSGFAWRNVFLLSGNSMRGFDVTTGSLRYRRGASRNPRFGLERWAASAIGETVDIERGTVGPRLECPGDNSVRGCEISAAVASGARIFAAARSTGPGPATCMVFAVESERLTRLWARALDGNCGVTMSSNGSHVFVVSRQQIVALDSSSGTETWRAAANFEQPPILVADKTRALSVEQRKLVARDSITGAVLPTRPTEASATDVILRDSVAYVIGKSRTGYALVRAEDLERGVSLWERQFATRYLVPLGADRDAIYLSGGSTLEILALDRSNGQPRYSRVFRDGRFATLVTGSSSAVLIARDHRLAALRRVEMPRAPETCRVKGRFRIETDGVKLPKTHPVRVADQIVWTDAQGRFEAEVRVHGDLLVEATLSNVRLTPEDCVRSEPVLLVPDRRTDAYDVELLIRAKTDCLDR